jgi:DNA-binding CsgD family transcriptional regulator
MTTTLKTSRLYPGMVCSGIEFFVVDNDHEKLKVLQAQKVINFEDLSFPVIQLLREEINKDETVKQHLEDMHPGSEIKQIKQFAACRYGGLDYTPDINNGSSVQGDFWDCPLRGQCKSEGTLCQSIQWNSQKLTSADIKLMKLTSSAKTNENIAEEMNLPMGTFHQFKKFLYEKLGVQTKQEVATIAMLLNII